MNSNRASSFLANGSLWDGSCETNSNSHHNNTQTHGLYIKNIYGYVFKFKRLLHYIQIHRNLFLFPVVATLSNLSFLPFQHDCSNKNLKSLIVSFYFLFTRDSIRPPLIWSVRLNNLSSALSYQPLGFSYF